MIIMGRVLKMGKCWNCDKDVFLKDDETSCDNCKVIVRYWCNSCAVPFDVQDKRSKKRKECKWCGFFLCPSCNVCTPDCDKNIHHKKLRDIFEFNLTLDNKIKLIVSYFEDVKLGKEQKNCEFGVPKSYAKTRIKSLIAKMKQFRVKDEEDSNAFKGKLDYILSFPIGEEFTIKKTREDGTYGQEFRDIFNLCVCMGKLKYEKKRYKDKNNIEIEFDLWTRTENSNCKYLDIENILVAYCKGCKKPYDSTVLWCNSCKHKRSSKHYLKGDPYKLVVKLSNTPTCRALNKFKKRGDNGRSESTAD